jgi:hypothetical protein
MQMALVKIKVLAQHFCHSANRNGQKHVICLVVIFMNFRSSWDI